MKLERIKVGMKVRTNKGLGGTSGMFVKQKHLIARSPDSEGVVVRHIPGHGGDCWWIKHGDAPGSSEVGAYCFNEFEPTSLFAKVRALFANLRRLCDKYRTDF